MHLAPYDDDLTTRLLRHIGHVAAPPSVDQLTSLQHAFLDAVPYENLDILLGRPTSIDPRESASHILRGRGGYCFHLNGTFAALLVSLGYNVAMGDGYRDPFPLREGVYEQPPFEYGLERLSESRWRFRNDKLATVDGIDFDATPVRRDVVDEREWWSIISDEFGLDITTIDSEERAALWQRTKAAHDAWDAAGRP